MATEVRQLRATDIVAELEKVGYTHVVWLPDTETGQIWEALANSKLEVIQTCREGENVPIAAGLLVAGKKPVVMMQNTGFLESGDSTRGLAIDVKLPLVILVGYRGYKDGGPMVDSAGTFLEPVVKAYGIPYEVLNGPATLPAIARAQATADKRRGPAAVLMARIS